jgi:hypothetical protein
MAYEIERKSGAIYSFADTGITMLPLRSAPWVGTARVLHAQILDQVERNGYDVPSCRARLPTTRKAASAARMMVTGPRALKRQADAYQPRSTDVIREMYKPATASPEADHALWIPSHASPNHGRTKWLQHGALALEAARSPRLS